jgi:hypothetical protein
MSNKGMSKAEVEALLVRNAGELNRLQAEITAATQTSFEKSKEAGAILREVKKHVPFGKWEDWLEENCPNIAKETARLYMRVADEKNATRLEEAAAQNGNAVADLSLRGVAKILSRPRGPRPAKPNNNAAASPGLTELLKSTGVDEIMKGLHQADKSDAVAAQYGETLEDKISAAPFDTVTLASAEGQRGG